MALSALTVWEVESGGSDNNGGGFVTGSSGTDFTKQTAAQFALTGVTSSGSGNTVLSSSAAATMVGNVANVISGTNLNTGLFPIVSVVAGTSITFGVNAAGSSICTGAASAGVINIGGAFATIAKAIAQLAVTGMIAYVKSATYSIATGMTTPTSSNPAGGIIRLIGYGTTRGDLVQPTIKATAAINALTDGQGGFRVENFIFEGNAGTGSNAVVFSGGASAAAVNCVMQNWSSGAITLNAAFSSVIKCSMTGNGSGVFVQGTSALVKNCYINGNTGVAINIISQGVNIIGNILSNNSGASTDAIQFSNNYSYVKGVIINNVIYNNGRHGILSTGNYDISEISGNIVVNNGGFGFDITMVNSAVDPLDYGNAFFGNTSGARSGAAGVGDITLTGVPFVAAGSANYALNAVAGQGASCRAVGYPGVLPAGGTGFADIGPLQHQDSPPIITQNTTLFIASDAGDPYAQV